MSSVSLDFPRPDTPTRRRPIDWRFLALALFLHAAVLLLPVLRESERAVPPRAVELWLQQAPPVAREQPENIAKPIETPAPAPRPVSERREEVKQAPITTLERTPETPPGPAARDLIESLERFEWQEPEAGAAPIARLQDRATLERLRRPLLPEFDNLFNGVVLPATATVVDRWLEPGGVHRVVVRLPNGMTVCGRQDAVNDFRPWEQMPMMFHECGGGGRK